MELLTPEFLIFAVVVLHQAVGPGTTFETCERGHTRIRRYWHGSSEHTQESEAEGKGSPPIDLVSGLHSVRLRSGFKELF